MRRAWVPLILVTLMLTMPWTSMFENTTQNDALLNDSSGDWTAAEAAKNWFEASGSIGVPVPISQGSGHLWVQTGPFDPLEHHPIVPNHLAATDDPFATGFLIMQLFSRDGELAQSIARGVESTIVDTLPEDAWVLRLPSGAAERASAITILSNDDRVRWIGSQHPAWRIHISLHDILPGQSINLDLTPAPELTDQEIDELETHLFAAGADKVRCDLWLCQVVGLDTGLIPALARDHRLLFTEPHNEIEIVNNYARSISKIDATVNNHNGGLDGTNEVGALSDSGLDQDHGDFNGRITGVYDTFGPDNSGADMNSGHGTHVAATMVGDGSGDSSSTGVAPAATFHFYQLEHDQSGTLARWGSLYDMFRDSWQKNARVQSNSWGAQTSFGQYTSDSRSADSFLHDYDDFLVLFASGNEGSQGSSSVAPPATAKNVLTVGASTTGRPGTSAAGQVASFSSIGPTSDGRIKPDLIAPGVQICSARAYEAQNPAGWSCSSARHSGTSTPLYMSADGTSTAAPVVGGAALLARQFLRQELNMNSPDSALIKAILINGAKDLGTANIPNMDEGWGQLDLEESLYPQEGIIAKSIFHDTSQTLSPGHSYSYTYALDGSYGLDVTLVWNDLEGSSSASQSSARLVNDLDLTVTAPDGTVYKGNDFANGFSTTGGSRDSLNNVERVRLGSSPTGDWQITVSHSGGYSQGYAIVISAVGNENPMSDLAVYSGSVWASQVAPLENDYVLLRMAWVNQAPAMTGAYDVLVEDITDNVVLWTGTRDGLAGGASDTFSFQKRFTTTGIHTIRLTLDPTNNVTEMNDEVDGTNNNVAILDVNVTAIGVRITPHNPDGSLPADNEEAAAARHRVLDPSTSSEMSWQVTLANEGTSQEEIELVVTPVQFLRDNGVLDAPQDSWEKILSALGPFDLTEAGGASDSTQVTITLRDTDADLDESLLNGPRYALPGTYVVDVTAFYRTNPTVSHTIRLEVEVLRIEGLETVLAGTTDLGAKPGDFASFSLSVLNTGNGETTYQLSCETPNRWQIELGTGNSSSLTLEPLARQQFLPVQVRVRIPTIVNGLPASGTVEDVTCTTLSLADPTKSTIESTVVEVFESRDFKVDLYDSDDTPLGSAATVEDISVLNGEQIEHSLVLENQGNIEISLTVRASPGQTLWTMMMTAGSQSDDRVLTLTLPPGDVKTINILVMVPNNVANGDTNQINFRTELSSSEFTNNRTRLVVQERVDLDIIMPESGTINADIGSMGTTTINIENTGNVDLLLDWSFGTLPDGWQVGFTTAAPQALVKGGEDSVTISLSVAPGTNPGPAGSLIILIDAQTLSGEVAIQKVGELGIMVNPSVWVDIQHDGQRQIQISKGKTLHGNLTVSNLGNAPCSVELFTEGPEGITIELDRTEWTNLLAGETATVPYSITGNENHRGMKPIWINATIVAQSGADVFATSSPLNITTAGGDNAGGLMGMLDSMGLPPWTMGIIAFVVLLLLVAVVRVLGRTEDEISSGEELLSAGEILGNQEIRREAALDIGMAEDDHSSGQVSQEEIDAALAQSAPAPLSLPPLPISGTLPTGLPPLPALPDGLPPAPLPQANTGPPLPATGLPDGWTMEQWKHYGHEYLKRTGQA
ncbi:MAG: S8 family serine peptidase [Candidatus Thermoplasmatota archaeon]|nr:S8 family serine peptidase [Candidatus Thermoplasmatota archaeon]